MRYSPIAEILHRMPSAGSAEHLPLRYSELMIARDLPGFTLADAGPDVRGWHVIAADRVSVGTIRRLIVEMRTGAIRYLMVELDPRLERRKRRVFASSVLVPVGLARRVDDLCTVLLTGVTSETLRRVQRIPDRPITRADEEETLLQLGLPSLAGVDASTPYVGAHFSAELLRQNRDCDPDAGGATDSDM